MDVLSHSEENSTKTIDKVPKKKTSNIVCFGKASLQKFFI